MQKGNFIGDIIRKNMRAIGKEDKYLEAVIINHWTDIVGKVIANYTVSVNLYNDKLYVKMNSSSLKDYVVKLAEKIKNNINLYVKKNLISSIIFY